jgi:hypothetical protein
MNAIRNLLKEGPKPIQELQKLYNSYELGRASNRILQYDLSGLKTLGLIEVNGDLYKEMTSKKTYAPQEYELAIEHSKRLLISDKENQRLDRYYPQLAVDYLIFPTPPQVGYDFDYYDKIWVDPPKNNDETSLIMQHIKTGYFRDLYLSVENYRTSILKYKLLGDTRPILMQGFLEKNNFDIYSSKMPKADYDELFKLRSQIAIGLFEIIDKVKHGIPLEGTCDFCPSNAIEIKPSKEKKKISRSSVSS